MSENTPEKPNKAALDALAKKLDSAQKASEDAASWENRKSEGDRRGLALAFRVGIELVSAVAVGAVLGWFIDDWLGTSPWGLLIFFFLGGGAGILNVYRMSQGYGYAVGYQHAGEVSKDKNPQTSAETEQDRENSRKD